MARDADVGLGLRWGLAFAVGYSALASVMWVVQGAAGLSTRGLSLPSLIGCYFIGGVLGGGLFGFLLPLSRTRAGSALLGAVVALPLMLGLGLVASSETLSRQELLIGFVLSAATLGPVAGYVFWEEP